MKISRIDTNEYESSHGKKPRGFGCWLFDVDGDIVELRNTIKKVKYDIVKMFPNANSIKILP